jgi:hypothetical protein
MAFRRYGGIQYSSNNNYIRSVLNNPSYLNITQGSGQQQTTEIFYSDLSLVGNLLVEGSVAVNENVDINSNVTINGTLEVTGNTTLGNVNCSGNIDGTNCNLSGTLNVTGTTTLPSATFTGNQITFSNNINGSNIYLSNTNFVQGNQVITKSYVDSYGGTQLLSLNNTWTGNNSYTYLPTCSVSPTQNSQLTNKFYVDSVANGFYPYPPCKTIATTNITLPNPASTTINGYTIQNGDNILLAGQGGTTFTNSIDNGIYTYTSSTNTLLRASVMNTGDNAKGALILITEGNSSNNYYLQTNNPATVGINSLYFVYYYHLQYQLGNTLLFQNNTLNVSPTQPQITSIGTTGQPLSILSNETISGTLNVTGNTTLGNVICNNGITLPTSSTFVEPIPGQLGYTVFNNVQQTTASSGTTYNLGSVTLDVGVYQLNGLFTITTQGTGTTNATLTSYVSMFTTTSASVSTPLGTGVIQGSNMSVSFVSGTTCRYSLSSIYVNTATSTPIYLTGKIIYSVVTGTSNLRLIGAITATRIA